MFLRSSQSAIRGMPVSDSKKHFHYLCFNILGFNYFVISYTKPKCLTLKILAKDEIMKVLNFSRFSIFQQDRYFRRFPPNSCELQTIPTRGSILNNTPRRTILQVLKENVRESTEEKKEKQMRINAFISILGKDEGEEEKEKCQNTKFRPKKTAETLLK